MSSNCKRITTYSSRRELIKTRGEHNHDISGGKLEARNVIKHKKDLSERFTPTVAVANAVLPITNDLATQFALSSKDNLIRTAARTRKQLDVNMPPIPVVRNFEIPEIFENFIRFDSESNGHEQIILCGDPEMLRVLEKSSFWLTQFSAGFKIAAIPCIQKKKKRSAIPMRWSFMKFRINSKSEIV